jgi:hypothetical protein
MSYETYKYLHVQEFDHSSRDVLDKHYRSTAELLGKLVVKSDAGYRVYPSRDAFVEQLSQTPESERVFHEVIFSGPQKLKFDIDSPLDRLAAFELPPDEVDPDMPTEIPTTEYDEIADLLADFDVSDPQETLNDIKYGDIFAHVLEAVRDAFLIVFGRQIPFADEIICRSHSEPVRKYSNHIIIDGAYVSDHLQAAEFTRRVGTLLAKRYHPFLDFSVNKRIQNFRVYDCHKQGDDRVKRVITGQDPARSLITNIDGCVLLPAMSGVATGDEQFQHTSLHSDDVQAVLDMCARDTSTHAFVFRRVHEGILLFRRVRPSECEFCGREHTGDNTLFVSVAVSDGVVRAYKHCTRYNQEHPTEKQSTLIGEVMSSVGASKGTSAVPTPPKIANWADKMIDRAINRGDDAPAPTLFDKLPGRHVYTSPTLDPFELVPTLVVHAAMKMGKTKALITYMATHFGPTLRQPIIRFVSFRQTFSSNIKEKFPDFTMYSDVKGPLCATRLIVQVESLHRLDIRTGGEPPDLLILDECESIFEQFDSGLLRGNFDECFAKFQYMIRYSKHVVCMDANVSDRTYRMLARMRPDHPITYHVNRHRNAVDDRYMICGEKIKWLGLLYSAIDSDERVAVPMSSLTEAKVLVHNLQSRYPEKAIKLYSSETRNSEKREHFADVDTYWSQLDVLVYTPTVSAGVSFEGRHFSKVFGYFTDQSCPVETCQQMIGRIRDVADHRFFICLMATGNDLPVTIDAIAAALHDKRTNLSCQFDESGLRREYGPTGDVVYHTGDYFHLWLENTRIRNLSKNSFIQRFVNLVMRTGAGVEFLSDDAYTLLTGEPANVDMNDALADIEVAHAGARAEIRAETCKKIADAPDLSEIEVEEIRALMVAQLDITDQQRSAFDRHRLRVDYRYSGEIDDKFVARYNDQKPRRIFKNLTRLSAYGGIDEAWKRIQAEELANHKYLMSMDEKGRNQDINRKYVFDQHRYAVGLLRLCGWSDLNDPQFIHRVTLAKNIRDREKEYWSTIGPACTEFQLRRVYLRSANQHRPNEGAYVKYLLTPVNRILGIMYGLTITAKPSDPLIFYLDRGSLFTTNPSISVSKRIPLISPPDARVSQANPSALPPDATGFSDEPPARDEVDDLLVEMFGLDGI